MALWKLFIVLALCLMAYAAVASAAASGRQDDSASATGSADGSDTGAGGASHSKSKSGAASYQMSPIVGLMSVLGTALFLPIMHISS